MRIHQESPDQFSLNHLYNVMFLMQFADHETTTQASANGLRHLLSNRSQWNNICRQPDLIGNTAEEILRIDSAIFAWRHITIRDC